MTGGAFLPGKRDKRKVAYPIMTEAPADPGDPQHELLEEMRYALSLAEERERSAKQEMDCLQQRFVTHYSSLEERVRSAERDAERAEVKAADVEDRVSKSLQALRLLRCHLSSAPAGPEAVATAEPQASKPGIP